MSIDWLEPEATVRGSVIVVAGRGERAGVYRRFARRIAFDGYRVRVVDAGHDATLHAIAEADASLPVVVVGSDSGATDALAAIASTPAVTGVVVAGLLVEAAAATSVDWDEELEIRSACPVHRGVLGAGDNLDRGAFGAPAAPVTAEVLTATAIPVLVVHGSADAISPADEVQRLAHSLPGARVVIVSEGRHDILNDVAHRSVAAEIVQFLERLRLPGVPEIITRVPGGVLAG